MLDAIFLGSMVFRELAIQKASSTPGSQAAAIIVGHTAENALMDYMGIPLLSFLAKAHLFFCYSQLAQI